MEITLTPHQAWDDFYKWMQERRDAGDFGQIPKQVQEAQYAYTGKRRYGLGEKRIRALLERYAPERYEFRTAVILKG